MHKHKKPANRAVWTGSSLQDVDLEDFDSTAFALSVRSSARFILLQIGGGGSPVASWCQVGIEVLITPIHRPSPLVPCSFGPFFIIAGRARDKSQRARSIEQAGKEMWVLASDPSD